MKALQVIRSFVAILVLAVPCTAFGGDATRIQLVGNIAISQQQLLTIVAAASDSGQGNFTPDKAIDGDTTTRWGSAFSEPHWLRLDLGSAQDLHSVVIDWEDASAASYEIQGSNNSNGPWTVLASETGGISQNHRIDTVSISGNYRYVRMYGITRTTIYGFSIWEMQVYGTTAGGPDSDNDGVIDSLDQCPGTPANTPVEADGCELDPIGGYDAPTSYPGYTLAWADEFNGTSLNTADWTHEIGTGCPSLCGWGNGELQYYRAENTTVANGWLTIEAKNESFGGSNYTSSRIKTQGKQFFQYGRIDIRAVMPQGMGPWPALWMLGESISSVGWPASGEIDIMEKRGGVEDEILGTAHWESPDGSGNNVLYGCENTGQCPTLSSGTFADEFHVFSIVWDANAIEWYLDGATSPYHTIDITPSSLSEFRAPFFLLMNIAVGGNLGGTPNNSIFPQKMIVDYVRVYQ